jgi:hypothetical protein
VRNFDYFALHDLEIIDYGYIIYTYRFNYLFPFSLDTKPPDMFVYLALLAAEQCVAVKLAADPASQASQGRLILLPGFLPAQTAGTEIGCLSYTMSVLHGLS